MSPRKCFFGCEGKLNLFAFPKDVITRQHWMQFLFSGHKQLYASVFLCSRHFTEDCFLNRAQYEAGFSARLVLKDGAVPSVKARVEESQAQTVSNLSLRCLSCIDNWTKWLLNTASVQTIWVYNVA